MDKNKKLFYTIIGAISALAAATAAFLALKKHRCAEQKLIEEIDFYMIGSYLFHSCLHNV